MPETASRDLPLEDCERLPAVGAVAAALSRDLAGSGRAPILYIVRDPFRAEAIVKAFKCLDGDLTAAVVPRWDGSEPDGIPASAHAMGRRMSVLRWLLNHERRPKLLTATPEALLRRVPARSIWKHIHLEFRAGDKVAIDELQDRLSWLGYVFDDRVDELGEAAIRGSVIEIFPAAAPRPCRLEIDGGVITAIRSYDPITQRSVSDTDLLIVDPATEELVEHLDPVPAAETFFDYLEEADIVFEGGMKQHVSDAFQFLNDDGLDASKRYLTGGEWDESTKKADTARTLGAAETYVPILSSHPDRLASFVTYIKPLLANGYRIVVAGQSGNDLRTWTRRLERALSIQIEPALSWKEACSNGSGRHAWLDVAFEEGFIDHVDKIVCVSLQDLAGRVSNLSKQERDTSLPGVEEKIRFGDTVVHFAHGVGVLEGLEIATDGKHDREVIRLRYADEATLLVPMGDVGLIWRYAGPETDVPLDRLKGDSWTKQRDKTVEKIAKTAERMVKQLATRREVVVPRIRPRRLEFERFCASFRYDLTPGQARAVNAIMADLEAGHPMDRLLCGDVGFGKTEVALRAMAAAVFSGRQATIVAPTTVLAQQHFDLIRRRFARHHISVAMLSRLQSPSEAKTVKEGIADGSIDVLIATHAICGKGISFRDLALVVIDEEQRFGTKQKNAIRALGSNPHMLSMTATPIPRTLQAGLVGLSEISVIDTPPRARRPVRTSIVSFSADVIAQALLEERGRGGQSFVVCPRVEDIEPIAAVLTATVPDFRITALHGRMTPVKVDRAMLGFAEGQSDVLLSTDIVESGLDVPNANTMAVYRPDRFGLAQLHQLRGRVGRGSKRATMLMMLDPNHQLSDAAQRRIESLVQFNHLGSGFRISARDLDLRGAGDLLGKEQAGHIQVIGRSLYRRLLENALAIRLGDSNSLGTCSVNVGVDLSVPPDYIPQPETRLELTAALDGIGSEAGLEQLRADFADRFGEPPLSVQTAFALVALRLRATELGVRKIDAGSRAIALTFASAECERLRRRIESGDSKLRWSDSRLVLDRETRSVEERLAAASELLDLVS